MATRWGSTKGPIHPRSIQYRIECSSGASEETLHYRPWGLITPLNSTHSGIVATATSRETHRFSFLGSTVRSVTVSSERIPTAAVAVFRPVNLRRRVARVVIYYDFVNTWLPPSLVPTHPCSPTSFLSLRLPFGTLAVGLGCFPLVMGP